MHLRSSQDLKVQRACAGAVVQWRLVDHIWFGLVWFGFEVISSRVYHQNKLLNQKAWQKLCYCE
jgi:hypothetical protein